MSVKYNLLLHLKKIYDMMYKNLSEVKRTMENEIINEDVQEFQEPKKTFWQGVVAVLRWIFRLRSVALSIPVAVLAIILAINNAAALPGPLLIGAGQNVITITKPVLVMGPLALTSFSILMTLFSKRVIYPWVISLFSLVLPLFLVFSNMILS